MPTRYRLQSARPIGRRRISKQSVTNYRDRERSAYIDSDYTGVPIPALDAAALFDKVLTGQTKQDLYNRVTRRQQGMLREEMNRLNGSTVGGWLSPWGTQERAREMDWYERERLLNMILSNARYGL